MSNSIKINQHISVNQSGGASHGASSSSVSHSSSSSFRSDVRGEQGDGDIAVSVTNSAGTASFKGTGSRVSVEADDDGRPVILIDGEDDDVVFDEIDDGEDCSYDLEALGDQGADLEDDADADADGVEVSVVESLDVDGDGGHATQTVSVMSALDLFLS